MRDWIRLSIFISFPCKKDEEQYLAFDRLRALNTAATETIDKKMMKLATKRSRPRAEDFTIGWVCALSLELSAAVAVLDEKYEDFAEAAQYVLGRIGIHNVVVACLPAGQIGTSSAAATAAHTRSLFPAVQYWLMVGIGGGVPSSVDDIRLGDVVVSQPQDCHGGVIQYDLGKTAPDGQRVRRGFLNAPPSILGTAVSKMRSISDVGESRIQSYLSSLSHINLFDRRLAGPDILFNPSYKHVQGSTCQQCLEDKVILRPRREEQEIVIHYGLIASGNQVMKDGMERDKLSAELGGVLCFEMEAAGLMNNFPCLVVRGICDYADSHKNDKWQPFAAASAAACAKEILSCVPTSVRSSSGSHGDTERFVHYPLQDGQTHEGQDSRFRKASERNEACDDSGQDSLFVGTSLTEDQQQRILESLSFEQIDARHATIRPAHSKTCEWVLSSSKYQNWLDDKSLEEHHGFLWIKGKPGTGKSTLMKFALASTKREMADSTIISFFFNARGEYLEKSTLGMYRSLVLQLLGKIPHLQNVFALRPPKRNGMGRFEWDVETLKVILEQAVTRIGNRSLICLIDALDECEDDQVRDMVAFFENLGHTAASSGLKFRTCFSSRHYPHVTIESGIELVLQEQDGHQQDMTDYLNTELKAGRSKLVDQFRAEILERASGIFLWVVLVARMLNEEYARGRIHALRRRLDEIPNGLEELFDNILHRDSQNGPELTLCLQWVLYARRPLRTEELYFAILAGIEPDFPCVWNPEEIHKDDMDRFILNHSKGLVEETKAKSRTVQFIHESVRDFFLRGKGLDNPCFGSPTTFPARSHESLKQCCHNYYTGVDVIANLVLNGSIPKASSDDAANIRQRACQSFPFLEYAVRNVLYHSDAADSLGCPQNKFVEEFALLEWNSMSNLLQRYDVRRHSANVSLLYILAEEDLPSLIRIERRRVPTIDIRGERYGFPPLAAAAAGNEKALRALLAVDKDDKIGELSSAHNEFSTSDHDLNEAVSSLLSERKPDVGRRDRSLLLWATRCKKFAVVKVLLASEKIDVNATVTELDQTPLSWAAQNNRADIAKLLLAHDDINVNIKDRYGTTPLSAAASNGHLEVVKLLLPYTYFNNKDQHGITPLLAAARYGHSEVVKLLLPYSDLSINIQDHQGWTPLFLAVGRGHTEVAKLLLAHSEINVNTRDYEGQTPLLWAAMRGDIEAVKLLLAHDGVEINTQDGTNGQTPLSLAVANRHWEVARLLRAHGGNYGTSRGSINQY
jgi:ankyrin repeat protein/nucleoside phosphorylase